MKRVILIDGNNLLFRSFFATSYTGNIMKNSKGFPTNAIYGFINMINKIINEEKPEYMLVAFDKGKTFRHEKYDFYKGGRDHMPDELAPQFPKAKELLDAWGIKHFEIDNYEADDIIGTLAKIVDEEDEFYATIISSDKDLLQLISDEVEVKLLKTNDFIRMDKNEFRKIYGVDPIKMIDIKALMGDASDNIPGVRGIGEKTAIKLLSEYQSLDNLYEHIDEITGKTKEKLIEGKESAYQSYEIATIYREVPLDFTLESLKYNGFNQVEFKNILEELEFHAFLKKFDLLDLNTNINKEIKKEKNVKEVAVEEFDYHKPFSYYIEVDHLGYSKGDIKYISFYNGEEYAFVLKDEILKTIDIFSSDTIKYTYDLKKSIVSLNKYNIQVNNVVFDSMIGIYLLDYTVKDDISFTARAFSYDIPLYEDLYGTEKKPKELDLDTLKKVMKLKAEFSYEERENILNNIKEEGELELFNDIEMPLATVLADMELTGIKLEKNILEDIGKDLKIKIDKLSSEIYEIANEEFNIASPKQLAVVLFEHMKLPYPKKSGSYTTGKEILDKLMDENPIIPKIQEYRTLTKLYSNYVEGLISEVRDDGRIHTIFNQTLTRTGRLSSVSPNLQNIPARDELGRTIRKAFVADNDSVLLSSDYSQVELRIFAHFSNTEHLKEAFINDKDIHTKTASDIFHIKETEVDKNKRRTAKAVNFGILYGISSFGLSEDLGINVKEAKEFLNKYLETYPGITDFMEKTKKDAYKNGYVKTIMNRKRVIPELNNRNFMIRTQGERMALNTPIQGSAADILKKAMVEIYNEFNKRGLKSKMLIQVHDELIFNVIKSELDEVKDIVKDIMENTYKLSVPLKVDIEIGKDLYEAK